MKSDEQIPGRRKVLRAAVFLGTAVASGLLIGKEAGAPGHTVARPVLGTGTRPAAGAPPAQAPPLTPPNAAAYRLRPMTGQGAPPRRRALPAVRTRPILSLPEPTAHGLVLTFDDGPDPRYTPAILRTLRRHDVRAMFFVCGEMAVDNRELLRQMAADGHVIGNHTWSHPLLTKLSRSAILSEVGRTSELVARTVGEAPQWFRAPYGAWNRAAFEIGAGLGMEPLAWTVDSLDWTEPGTTTISRRVLDQAEPGAIVLAHDAGGDRSQTVRALAGYLPELLDRGYVMTLPRQAVV
ncbi:polysaccharide deacetylase family protein [Streptomyces sp. NPDC006879]|uniref:polysaccharide deacetylase family protein n=1 Tax=Streptomyces sp. NPDC006879 TaxID=3364767 RepID=UPI0036CAD1A2